MRRQAGKAPDIGNSFMINETWKDVPGWEGFYQVSDAGRVRSMDDDDLEQIEAAASGLHALLKDVRALRRRAADLEDEMRSMCQSWDPPSGEHLRRALKVLGGVK